MLNPNKLVANKAIAAALSASLAIAPLAYPISAFAAQNSGYASEAEVLADKNLTDKEKDSIIAQMRAANEAAKVKEETATQTPAAPEPEPEPVVEEKTPVSEPEPVVENTNTNPVDNYQQNESTKQDSATENEVTESEDTDNSAKQESPVAESEDTTENESNEKGSKEETTKVEPGDEESEDSKSSDKGDTRNNDLEGDSSKGDQKDNEIVSEEPVKGSEDQVSKGETTPSTPVKETEKPVVLTPEPEADEINETEDIKVIKDKAIDELIASNIKSETVQNTYNHTENNSQYFSRHAISMTTETFIASIGEEARQICQEKDLYASVMIAQAIIESGSGSSGLSRAPYNNLFGIKGYGTNGRTVNMATSEDSGDGTNYNTRANFAAYDNTKESLEAYADLLANGLNGYYSGAWKKNTNSYKDACNYLQGRYASSTIYAAALIDTIETYDLTRYDKPLDYAVKGKIYDKDLKVDGEVVGGVRDMDMNDYAALLATATSRIGIPYVWGGTDPEHGVDCSGFCMTTYRDALGIDITRTTYTQQHQGKEVNFNDLRMGDLVFFQSGGDTNHVGMYIGDGFYIESTRADGIDGVRITAMEHRTPTFAKRILDFDEYERDENGEIIKINGELVNKEESNDSAQLESDSKSSYRSVGSASI